MKTVSCVAKMLRAFCVQNRDFWSIRGRERVAQAIDLMVGVAGFEPTTPASRTHLPAPYPSQYQELNPTPDNGINPENSDFSGSACRLRAKPSAGFAAPAAEGPHGGHATFGRTFVCRFPLIASGPHCIGR